VVNRSWYVSALPPSAESVRGPVFECQTLSGGVNHLTLVVLPDPSGQQSRVSENRQFREVVDDTECDVPVPVDAELRYLIGYSV
jgi:hypothetical protein